MPDNGPIIVIEDDNDDQQILGEVFEELSLANKLIFFADGETALEYLTTSDVRPFIIISDINMPKLDGFELSDKIFNNEELRMKCIPYIFFTTANSQKAVIHAYSRGAHGFFVKPNSYPEIKRVMKHVVSYWQDCVAPNKC